MNQESIFPKRFNFKTIQVKWIKFWKDHDIYAFDSKDKKELFTIDTPPPFVSGTLHMGHILNHSWIDFVARYHKLKGDNVYFPQGFDCHDLPVELAVSKNYNIKKENREKFLEKCIEWVNDNIVSMKIQLNELGYSTDWNYIYQTMDDDYKRKVQLSLLDFYEKGLLYREKFPTHFCVNCETSVAKAEVGYQDEVGKLWYIRLPLVGREKEYITIATTRPEYMEACVAVLVNPNDQRYLDLSAAEVEIPFADRKVRIYMDKNVDMNFGTGIVYVCTYGDEMDIKWKLEYDLDEIQIFTENGLMNQNSKYQGLNISEAREQIVKDLENKGLIEKIEDYEHSIIIHSERSSCRQPIEYLPIYQWFINVKDYTKEIIESAESMNWYPDKHKQRLIDWANGLDWNWVISRQRVFGTPIPFWYCQQCGMIITPKKEDLPVDPVNTPSPIEICPKCKSDEIIGEKDICDCWIDSSITPLIISKWQDNEEFYKRSYLNATVHRPQGYEIIRTWMFYTLFRCKVLTGKPPFSEAMINGMVAGPDGRHMSKSYGNIVSPDEVMPEFGTDAIRQWAALGSLGDDYPFDFTWINLHNKQQITNEIILKEQKTLPKEKFDKKYGRRFEQLIGTSRFITKIWNAYRFLYLNLRNIEISDLNINSTAMTPIDSYHYSEFNKILKTITDCYDGYNWHDGFITSRIFFWNEICDNYIEAIKYRFYAKNLTIRKNALKIALNLFYKILICFGFIMPFVTEEIYNNLFKRFIKIDSIHLETWPTSFTGLSENSAKSGGILIEIIKILRNIKSKLQVPLNQDVSEVIITTPRKEFVRILSELGDVIKNTIRIKNLTIEEPSELEESDLSPNLEEKIDVLNGKIYFFK